MPVSFDFRQQLLGEWFTARAFLVEQFDRLYANLAILSPLVDALGITATDLAGNPIFTVGYTASSALMTNPSGTPAFTQLLPFPLGFTAATVLTPAVLAVNTNNYAPTGFAAASIVRLAASAPVDLTGITASSTNVIKLLANVGTQTITLKHASGSSSAANRFRGPSAADVSLTASSTVQVWYDTASTVWQVF